jgi:hypothetical protein
LQTIDGRASAVQASNAASLRRSNATGSSSAETGSDDLATATNDARAAALWRADAASSAEALSAQGNAVSDADAR